MKFLVTGGTVFVSRFTAEYFVKKGHDVFVLNRGNNQQSDGVTHICGDRHSLGDTLRDYNFDLVIDVTAYNKNDVMALYNALGDFGQYVFISSSAVYPETLPQPFNKNQECGINMHWGDYGTNKIDAENYLLENIPNVYILRPPYLYGEMNNVYREAFVFECAENDLPFYAPQDNKMQLQFFHAEDMCRFIEVLLEKRPMQQIFNVGNDETVDINEWVKLCYGVMNKTPHMKYVNREVNQRDYFPFLDYDYKLDVSAMHMLMNDTIPLDEGLKRSYAWYKNNRDKVRRKEFLKYIEQNF